VVVVDYAHSQDALRRTLAAARELTAGRLAVVFGAGGQSTPQKRRPMGQIAGRRADLAIVTNDNPRGEDPRRIAEAVAAGVREGGRAELRVELDRRKAIAAALAWAEPDDCIVVAGKGHERGQTIGTETLPFDDAEVVRELLR
jgi:UDP-N-acetylmuramoyl-L-alanyl-D-glutamate--2,6-diaminopimelate ligase